MIVKREYTNIRKKRRSEKYTFYILKDKTYKRSNNKIKIIIKI